MGNAASAPVKSVVLAAGGSAATAAAARSSSPRKPSLSSWLREARSMSAGRAAPPAGTSAPSPAGGGARGARALKGPPPPPPPLLPPPAGGAAGGASSKSREGTSTPTLSNCGTPGSAAGARKPERHSCSTTPVMCPATPDAQPASPCRNAMAFSASSLRRGVAHFFAPRSMVTRAHQPASACSCASSQWMGVSACTRAGWCGTAVLWPVMSSTVVPRREERGSTSPSPRPAPRNATSAHSCVTSQKNSCTCRRRAGGAATA
jgi:hypothetical protein